MFLKLKFIFPCLLQNQLNQTKQAYEDEIERVCADREKMRKELEGEREEAIGQLTREKDELAAAYEREKDQLAHEVAMVASERDTALINAENERQQLLGLAQQETK